MGPVIMAAGPGLGFGPSGIDIRPGSGAGGGGGGLDDRPSSAGPTTIQQHMQHHQQLHQHQQHYAAAVGSRAVNSAGSVSYLNAMPGRQRIVAWLEESDQSFATVDETTNEPVRLKSPGGKQAEGEGDGEGGGEGESGRDGSADAAALERLGLFLSSLPAGQYEDRGSPTAAPPSASGESSGGAGGPSGAWSAGGGGGGGGGGSSSTGTHAQSGYSAMATAGSGVTGPSYTSQGIPGGGFTGAGLSGARRASPNNSKRDLLPPPAGGHSGGAGGRGGSGGNPLGGNPMARTRSSQEPVRLVPQMGSAEESAQAGAAPSPLPAAAGALGAGSSGAGGARGAGVLAPSLSFANGVGSGTGAGAASGAGVGAGTGLGPGASAGVGGGTGSGAGAAGAAGGAGGAKEKESLRVQALSNAIRHSSHGGEKDRDSHREKEPLGRSTTQYSEEGGSAAAVAGSAVAATAGFGGSARGLGGGFASDTASDTAAGHVHLRDGSFPPSPAPDKSWYAVSPLVDFHPGSSPPPPFIPGQSPLRDSGFKLPLPAVGGNGAGNSGHEGLGEIQSDGARIGAEGKGDVESSVDGGKGGAAEVSSHEEASMS
ncbi:unnamed protein product [Closterium sp. Yama58-4]|nr:unnamed protein product [Closterium sp. Yama58-4]